MFSGILNSMAMSVLPYLCTLLPRGDLFPTIFANFQAFWPNWASKSLIMCKWIPLMKCLGANACILRVSTTSVQNFGCYRPFFSLFRRRIRWRHLLRSFVITAAYGRFTAKFLARKLSMTAENIPNELFLMSSWYISTPRVKMSNIIPKIWPYVQYAAWLHYTIEDQSANPQPHST